MPRTRLLADEQGDWVTSPCSFGLGVYIVACVVWILVGVFYLPILSMVLTPLWMVLFVSVLPRVLPRLVRRRNAR